MVKRFGVELSEWHKMSTLDQVRTRRTWMIEAAKAEAERQKKRELREEARRIKARRKKIRKMQRESMGVDKKKTPEDTTVTTDSLAFGLKQPPPFSLQQRVEGTIPPVAPQEGATVPQLGLYSQQSEMYQVKQLGVHRSKIRENIVDLETQRGAIDPSAQYKYEGKIITGEEALRILDKNISFLKSEESDITSRMHDVRTRGTEFRRGITHEREWVKQHFIPDWETQYGQYGATLQKTKEGQWVIVPQSEESRFKETYEEMDPFERHLASFFAPLTQFTEGATRFLGGLIFGEPQEKMVTKTYGDQELSLIKRGPYFYDPITQRRYTEVQGRLSWDIGYGESFFIDKTTQFPTLIDVPLSYLGMADEWKREWLFEHPEHMVSGGGGEAFLMATLGFVTKPIGTGIKAGTKGIVKKTPEIVAKTKEFTVKGWQYDWTRGTMTPFHGPVMEKTFKGVTRVGETPFWKHLYGWSTGDLVRVVNIPLREQRFLGGSRTGVTEDGFTAYGKLSKYKGWGAPEWIPKTVFERQPQIGKDFFHLHRYTETAPGVGERLQIFESTVIGKPKGHLWWKQISVQTASIREVEQIGVKLFTITEPSIFSASMGFGGVVKTPAQYTFIGFKQTGKGLRNLYKDLEASQSLVPPSTVVKHIARSGFAHSGLLAPGFDVAASQFSFDFLPVVATVRKGTGKKLKPVSEVSLEMPLLTQVSFDEQIQMPVFEQLPEKILDTEEKIQQDFLQDQLIVYDVAQDQVQMQKQDLEYSLLSVAGVKTKIGVRHVVTPPEYSFDIPFKFSPLIPLPEVAPLKHTKKRGGFDVFVKERYITHGIPTGAGDFTRINRTALSKTDALKLGGAAVDNSSAQSFFLKPVDAPASPLDIRIGPWVGLKNKFYTRGGVFIEKRKHAIDTPGEIEGISALGWLNRQPRKSKGRPVRKSKTVIETPAGFVLDDLGSFDMLNEFENMIRNMDYGGKRERRKKR